MPAKIGSISSPGGSFDYLRNSAAFVLLVAVCLILLALLFSQIGLPLFVIEIVGLLLACIIVPARWPYGAVVVLSIASVMPRLSVEIGGWNVRPEHCATFLVLVVLLIRCTLHESLRAKLTFADLAVVAYTAWNYVSSLWMSPDPRSTLRWALLNNLVVLPYFLIRFLVTDERILRWVFRAYLVVGIAECAFALAAFASRQILGTSFGTEIDQYAGGLGGVYGTQYEPNLLGSFAGCTSIILLVFYFLSPRKSHWLIGGAIISVAALIVSLSRAAFLAFALALIILAFVGARAGLVSLRKLLTLGLILAFFIAPIAVTGGRNLLSRFATLSVEGFESDAEAVARLTALTAAFEDIAQHPLVGNGTASFQLLADAKQLPILGDRPWVGNSPIRILHDTGAIGLLLIGVVAVAIGRSVRQVMVAQGREREIVFALTSGCLVYAIAFMSTEGTMLSFFWVHIGLLASACSVARTATT
ncbi:MAG: O-antigen ligase family protein [Candidatus Acidiferrum sp.]|jgi:O-antigen ligase